MGCFCASAGGNDSINWEVYRRGTRRLQGYRGELHRGPGRGAQHPEFRHRPPPPYMDDITGLVWTTGDRSRLIEMADMQ
jgi:hypothetical protein